MSDLQSSAPSMPVYRLRSESTPRGESVQVVEVNGTAYYVGSRYDPSKEAEKFAARLPLASGDALVLIGGGARVVESILRREGRFQLIYFEPFKELRDEPQVSDPRLHVFTAPESLFEFLRSMSIENVDRFQTILYPSLKTPLGAHGEWLLRRAGASFEERIAEIQTVTDIGFLVVKNILANLPRLGACFPVRRIFNRPPDFEFACVAASGPSLDKSGPELAAVQDRMRVIAAASAVLPLMDHGVVPDVAVVLDPRPDEIEYVELVRPSDRERVFWVVAATARPEIFRLLPPDRTAVFMGDHPLEDWLQNRFGGPGTLKGAGSVILPAFDLACRMGAREIILAGADFSLGQGMQTHGRGNARMKKQLSTPSRFATLEDSTFKEALERAPRRIEVDGRVYRTGENLLAYRRQMEEQVAAFGGRCRHILPALAISGAEACQSISDLKQARAVPKGREFFSGISRGGAMASEQLIRTVREELLGRLGGQIETDPLFRTAVESGAFQIIRQKGLPAAEVIRAEADRIADELKRTLQTSGEDK